MKPQLLNKSSSIDLTSKTSAIPDILGNLQLTGWSFSRQLRWMLLVTGVLGLVLGVLSFRNQVAVEQGQVLSGIVRYPLDSASYIYNAKLWNIWGQLATLGLSLGLSDAAMSLILSALAGLFTIWGFALWIMAFTRNIVIAVLAPFICVLALYVWSLGYSYPLMLISAIHTYGMLSLTFMLVTTGFIAVGWSRPGFFLLGFALLVHPALGAWTNLVVFLVLLTDYRNLRSWLKPLRWILPGYVMSVVSYLFQRFAYPVPYLDASVAEKYLSAYLQYWDYHRKLSSLQAIFQVGFELTVLINVVALCLILLWLYRSEWSRPVSLMIRGALLIVLLGVSFTLFSELPLPLSNLVSVLMPARYLNLIIPIYLCILIGVLWHFKESWWQRTLWIVGMILFSPITAAFITILLIIMLLRKKQVSRGVLILASVLMSIYVVYFRDLFFVGSPLIVSVELIASLVAVNLLLWIPVGPLTGLRRMRLERFQGLVNMGIMLIVLASFYWIGSRAPRLDWDLTGDPHDAVWTSVTQGKGSLLVGGMVMGIQQATRRPTLGTPGLSGLPYSIEGAPNVETIMKDIYGMDFFNPPADVQHTGEFPTSPAVQQLWESRTEQQWLALAQRFDFTQILTPPGWHLALPVIAHTGDWVLYALPKGELL